MNVLHISSLRPPTAVIEDRGKGGKEEKKKEKKRPIEINAKSITCFHASVC